MLSYDPMLPARPMATRATVGNIEMLAVADRGVSIKPDDKNTRI